MIKTNFPRLKKLTLSIPDYKYRAFLKSTFGNNELLNFIFQSPDKVLVRKNTVFVIFDADTDFKHPAFRSMSDIASDKFGCFQFENEEPFLAHF